MSNEGLTPPDEAVALMKARVAMFRADALSSEVNERFSQLLLAFAAAAIAFFAEKIHSEGSADPRLGVAAVMLCVSLLVGAGQLILAHIAALVRSGFSDPDALSNVMENLEPAAKLRLLRQVLAETKATRFWPDSIMISRALAHENIIDGITEALAGMRRLIQWQALLYRLQVMCAALAGVPVVLAILS